MNSDQTEYSAFSAGGMMATNVPTIKNDWTVGETKKLFLESKLTYDTFNYIYIIDRDKKIKGVISFREILDSDDKKKVIDLSPDKLIVVHPHTNQERVAHLALKNNLKAIPVVDHGNVFLGEIPSKKIMRAIHHETTEDLFRIGGIIQTANYDDILKLPVTTVLKHRAPWLIVGLLGGIFAAGIVDQFEEVLSRNLILASFIPLIVYMADAVGTQMEAFIIRDIAVNPLLDFGNYLKKQLIIALIIGFGICGILYIISLFIFNLPQVSYVVSIALFLAIMTSLFTGLFIPFFFNKFGFDPANASGPIATIIQDVLSITVYFFIASLIL